MTEPLLASGSTLERIIHSPSQWDFHTLLLGLAPVEAGSLILQYRSVQIANARPLARYMATWLLIGPATAEPT
eukprot:11065838-Lingulodinium_polyedra.AAC.1